MDRIEKNRERSRNRYYMIRNNPVLLKEHIKRTTECVRKWRIENPEKVKAQRIVFVEKRAGRIKAKPCEVCGVIKSECHHEDYSKPLEIIWLCKKHHRDADMNRRLIELCTV